MFVSIISPACNEGDFVRSTVASIHQSMGSFKDYEVIISDDASTDGCSNGLDKDPKVKVYRSPDRIGCSKARGIALGLAQGDMIVACDAHCHFTDGAILEISKVAYTNPVIAQPCVINHGKQTRGGGYELSKRGVRISRPRSEVKKVPALLGTIYAHSRETLVDRMGGFPHLPGYWGSWEQMLSTTAWFMGIDVKVLPIMGCKHLKSRKHGIYHYGLKQYHIAKNANYYHSLFFPRGYKECLRKLLDIKYGRVPLLLKDPQHHTKQWIEKNAIRTEDQFLNEVLGYQDWIDCPVISQILERHKRWMEGSYASSTDRKENKQSGLASV